MDDKNDDIFKNDGFFSGSFFGGNFDKQFRDAMKDMDEMFKRLGDFHIDFHPPSVTVGGSIPGYLESPRDMMLKRDTSCNDEPCEGKPSGVSTTQPRMFHPGFRSPFNRDMGDADSVEFTIAPSSNNNFRFQMSSQSTSVKQNPDGSMEKIVKTIENGQKCTTITKTDKSGNTSTTTTCEDRPGDIPRIRDKPLGPFTPPPAPVLPGGGRMGDLNEEDRTIFQRYFTDWFKPKDK